MRQTPSILAPPSRATRRPWRSIRPTSPPTAAWARSSSPAGNTRPRARHLEAAYGAAPGQRATRQLLGESYALAGDAAGAVALWRTVDLGQGQLSAREWWYGAIGETAHQQRITQAIERLSAEP